MKTKVGIVGGAGYTGGEMLRLLLNHPHIEISFIHSNSSAEKPVSSVHHDLHGETDLTFSAALGEADVLFLCVGHGEAAKFLSNYSIPQNTRIIDLSQDFRLNGGNAERAFVYGLPELNRETIKTANNIANPGCFATAIQMGLLPLAEKGMLTDDVHVSGITGSTGAGHSFTETSHFSWRNNNISPYKVLNHQHLSEIGRSLNQLQPKFINKIRFVPYRGNFSRGILTTSYTQCSVEKEEVKALFADYYKDHPFVHLTEAEPDVKQVVNTNKCLIHVDVHDGMLITVTAIDNLLKGASGQAIQNMNLMLGLDETAGLKLKATAF